MTLRVRQDGEFIPVDTERWVRPADWLPLPELTEADQGFVALYAVPPAGSVVAFQAAGAYTVDWGDGTVENFAANAVAEHEYVFSNSSLGAATSEGWKQAVIKLTMQAGQSLTRLDLHRKHSSITAPIQSTEYRQITVAGGLLRDFYASQPEFFNRAVAERAQDVVDFERVFLFGLVGTFSIKDLQGCCRRMVNLRRVTSFACFNTPAQRFNCTTQQSTNTIQHVGHGQQEGDLLIIAEAQGHNIDPFSGAFTSPSGLALGGVWWVRNPTANTYQLSGLKGGPIRAITADSSVTVSYGASLNWAFEQCVSLEVYPSFDMNGVISLANYGRNCFKVKELQYMGNTGNVIDFSAAFENVGFRKMALHDLSQGRTFNSMHNCSGGSKVTTKFPPYNLSEARFIGNFVANSPDAGRPEITAFPKVQITFAWQGFVLKEEEYTHVPFPAATGLNNFFNAWVGLKKINGDPQAPLAQNLNFYYSGCSLLNPIPAVNAPAAIAVSNMYNLCRGLIPESQSFPVLQDARGVFNGYLGANLPSTWNTSNWTNVAGFATNMPNVSIVPAYNFSNVNTADAFLSGSPNVAQVLYTGLSVNHSLVGSSINKANLEAAFTRLGRGAAARTITITGIPGAIGAHAPIAKTGCGTTLNSAVVSCADTSGLAIGMIVTGTGISVGVAVTFQDAGDTVTNGTRPAPPNGTRVWFSVVTTSTFPGLPSPATFRELFVVNRSGSVFQVAQTVGGTPEVITTNGSGTMFYGSYITAINPGVSFTLDVAASATGTITATARDLNTALANVKNFTVAG